MNTGIRIKRYSGAEHHTSEYGHDAKMYEFGYRGCLTGFWGQFDESTGEISSLGYYYEPRVITPVWAVRLTIIIIIGCIVCCLIAICPDKCKKKLCVGEKSEKLPALTSEDA